MCTVLALGRRSNRLERVLPAVEHVQVAAIRILLLQAAFNLAPTLGQGGEDIHGSQFRILYQADSRLDGEETVFGKVVAGQDILEGLTALAPCTVVSSENCDPDFSSALVIEEIIVEPKAA